MVKWLILCGNEENWNIAIKNKVWGAKPFLGRLWNKLLKGDIVFFYVTKSRKRIIGVGTVREKLDPKAYSPKPIWPDEVSKGQVIYPYRLKFETIYVCENALIEGISVKGLKISKQKGMSRILDNESILELHRRVQANWSVDIPLPGNVIPSSN